MDREKMFALAVHMATPRIVEGFQSPKSHAERTEAAAATIGVCYDYVSAAWDSIIRPKRG